MPAKATTPVLLTTDQEKTIYALGLSVHRSLGPFGLSSAELEIIRRAIGDAAANQPAVDINIWGPKIEGLAKSRGEQITQRQKADAQTYLAKAAAESGAVRLESGVIYKPVTPGSGASPQATDTVKVHYRGTLVNGTEFDSSYKRNEPAQFALNAVIPCWTQGVQKMKIGEKAILTCPADAAYGDRGRPTIPGGAALIFQIELLEIVAAPAK